MTLRITEIGKVKYQEEHDERVWLHLIIVDERKPPVIYATIAPDISLAVALAGMYGKVWETWALQEVMDALANADSHDGQDIGVDIGGVKM